MSVDHHTALRPEICLNGLWDFRSHAETTWTQIRVPGNYSGTRQYWGGEHWDGFDYPRSWEGHPAIYRRTFTLPSSMQDMNVHFYCEGCAHHSIVKLNGIEVGEWHDGYTPMSIPLTHALCTGNNTLEIHISERKSDLFDDYATHRRGLWQDTFIKVFPKIYVGDDLFINTSVKNRNIICHVPITNFTEQSINLSIECQITELDGKAVKTITKNKLPLEPGQSTTSTIEDKWIDPHFWSPHDPHLYLIHTKLINEQGKILDCKTTRFGFREVSIDGTRLLLNGDDLFLRGHGGHDLGDIQHSRQYMYTWLSNLKKLGINFMRLHCSPKYSALYEVADELGIVLEAEAALHFKVPQNDAIWEGHLQRLIKAQRNHPSIIVWSVSNELRWRGGGEKSEMIAYAKQFDPTRPVFASDFSLESQHGDICIHHYDPETVFEDWQQYGENKPMIWDELGSVWQHDRPLDNGTSGYEVQAQDYATGLWHDGNDQILKDIRRHHDGKVFNGKRQRICGFVAWDLAYNFFRWQPLNNNQILNAPQQDSENTGVKLKHIRPCASTINIWDQTLPEFEPNPGYYLFEKYMHPVRFFDEEQTRLFFSSTQWTTHTQIFYDDTRPADELTCLVQTLDGEVLSSNTQPLNLIPGQIMDNVRCTFLFPHIKSPTPVQLVREFRFKNQAGYRDQIPAKIFPQCNTKKIRLKKLGSFNTQGLEYAGVHIESIKEPENLDDILLVNPETFEQPDIQSHIAAGGKVLCMAGKTKQTRPQSQIIDTFHDIQGQLNTAQGVESPANCTWYGWSANQHVMIKQQHNDLQQEAGRLSFDGINEAGAYAYAILKHPLLQADEGHVYLKYLNDSENWQTKLHQNANYFDRTMGILLRDHKHNWFLSSQATSLNLTGKNGYSDASLGSIDWLAVNTDSDGMLHDAITIKNDIAPDWQTITGIGLYLYQLPTEHVDFSIAKIQFKGRGAPSALIPLHGPKHRLLNHIDQQDLSYWPNGACSDILDLPQRTNTRVILAGNHDGMGASLYEQLHGKGVAVVTSLNLNQLNDVPTASAIFDNIITYLKQYQPEHTPGTYVCVNQNLNQYLNQMDVVREQDIKQAATIITDGPSIHKAMDQNLNHLVNEGANLLICNIDESCIGLIRDLTGQNLQLTQPYLDERKHCVKAAISWTKSDTPRNLVEYYQGIMIPQPFENNHEPLLSGISNLDLNWDGQDMFTHGIEIKGMDPVRANDEYIILISNWKIDWSKPHWGGEYIHAAKDLKRADWFINRDPVVLKIKHGQGQIILCQLDFLNGNEKARRVMAQLLTNLNCAMGYPTNFASTDKTFDLSEKALQIARFNQQYQFLPPAKRQYDGIPEHLHNQPQSTVIKKATFQLIADTFALQYAPYLIEELWESYVVMSNKQSAGNTSETLTYIQQQIETWEHQIQVFQLSVGLEDLKRNPNGQPTIDLDTFASNLQQIVKLLAKNGAKLYWTPIIAIPEKITDYAGDQVTKYNEVAQKIMDEHDVYTNDLHHFMLEQIPEYLQADKVTLDMAQQQMLAKQVGQAIIFFGAQ